MRACTRCKVEKEENQFSSNGNGGRRGTCKLCCCEIEKSRREKSVVEYWVDEEGKTKCCPTCKEEKQFKEFFRNKTRPDGHGYMCKECEKKYRIQYRQENKEVIRQKKEKYREEHKEEIQQATATYNQEHKEQKRQTDRRYRATVIGRIKKAACEAARRAAKMQSPQNDFTAKQWQMMLEQYGHRCAYCGRKMQRLTQDHITPLSKGGSHTYSNIVPACLSCNSKKQAGPVPVPVQPLLLVG